MTGQSRADRRGASTLSGRGIGGRRFLTAVLVAVVALLGLPRPAAAAPGISGEVGPPSGTAFSRTITFQGILRNTGTQSPQDDLSAIVISNAGSVGLGITSIDHGGSIPAGGSAPFTVMATVTGAPGSTAQLKLQAMAATGSSSGVSTNLAGGPFTVDEAVALVVTAERRVGGSLEPCPALSCSASFDHGMRYALTVTNRGGANATVSISAPVPSNTTPAGTSTIPGGPVTLPAGGSQTFYREVAVNDPPNDIDSPQPGTVITFTGTATYGTDSPALASRPAAGSPASFSAVVHDPRLIVTNDMTDINGGQLAGGDTVDSVVRIENNGNANATNTVAAVTLTNLQNPTNVRIDGLAASSDLFSATGSTLTVRVGTGANGSNGGSIAPGGAILLTFTATTATSPSNNPATAESTASVSFDNGGVSPKTAAAQLGISVTRLRLVKVVDNGDGGTAGATDFTLTASGPTPISGAGGTQADVNPGTYTLSETNLPGYTPTAWSCTAGTLSGAVLTLAAGDDATCTITNDDVSPHLTLVKRVVNDDGRTATANDFTLSASGPTPISGAGGVAAAVRAGTYTLTEDGHPDYTASAWVCTGTGTQSGASITLAPGQAATCTITNDDNDRVSDLDVSIAATPIIVKSGDVVTYTVTVKNHGPDVVAPVLTDAVPSTMTFQSVSGGGACTTPGPGSSGTIVCRLASLDSGQSAVVSIALKVGPVRKGTITNTVNVAPSGGVTDPTPDNNTAAYTVRVK